MAGLPYARFPVIDTIDITDGSEIRRTVDRMVEAYAAQETRSRFSFRILLPRDEKSTARTKKMGLALQGEFVLALRRHNLVPNVREVRYVHDEHHYGWLLADPQVHEQFEKGI